MSPDNLAFIGFNSNVLALDRDTGAIVWKWKSPRPRYGGYVTLLLDGDRLIVSVNGYMHCLDPVNGGEFWQNELRGFGTGVASIATVRGRTSYEHLVLAAAAEARNG